IPLNILVPAPVTGTATRVNTTVTVKNLNRTYFNLGFGRACYLIGTACSDGPRWRIGIDIGPRYGTASAQFQHVRHRPDTVAAVFAALHTDLEIPCCAVVFIGGLRLEGSYTWSDVLQERNVSDVVDINLLLTAGVRF